MSTEHLILLFYNMGPFTPIVFFLSTFCLQQSFSEDVFPSFSGDVRLSGYIIADDAPEMFVTFWWSEKYKASRQDYKSNEVIIRQIKRATKGEYGTEVFLRKLKKTGETNCIFRKGTAAFPVKYEPFLGSVENTKLVANITTYGITLDKWAFYIEGERQVLYVRKDESGPVPIRVVGPRMTFLILNYSTTVVPDLFSYNENECTEKEGYLNYENIQDLPTNGLTSDERSILD